MYCFEEMTVGWSETYGSHEMTESGIIAFAEQFDPQPMHTDPEAAAETQYGGLIASGLHTVGVATRLLVENFLDDSANRGGLGLDALTWHRPVRPGDILRVRHEVVERRESGSHPDAGIVVRDLEVFVGDDDASESDGEVACSWTTTILMGKRDP